MKYILFADIVEANGKTIRENNLELTHHIPIGTLVEVDLPDSEWHRCRLYVRAHLRDCDGSPLYGLGRRLDENETEPKPTDTVEHFLWRMRTHGGFSDDCLLIIAE